MTVDWVELAWSLMSVALLLFSAVLFGDAWTDVRMMQALGHKGRRWLVAMKNVLMNGLCLWIQFVFTTIGVLSFFTPTSPAISRPRYIVTVALFFSMQAFAFVVCVYAYRARWKLRQWSGVDDEAVA